ncbi:MAG: hypothetical protein C4542_09030 [Dehalococcoidia bacterium]|nr:MAG: hypothetical protein C4542_09030 [Dehalococcoidia bacterium]
MKLTVNRLKLLGLLGDINKVVPSRPTLPIWSCTLFQAKEGYLMVAGTDLDTALVRRVKAKIIRPGEALCQTKKLVAFLKALAIESVVISLVAKQVKVEAGKVSTDLQAWNVRDYPPLPRRIMSRAATVAGLSPALGHVAYAATKEDYRPVLAGVYMDGNRLVAADGFRLAQATLKASGKLPEAIIQNRACQIIRDIFPGKVKVNARIVKTGGNANTLVQFEDAERLLITRAVQGNYPDWEKLIPTNGRVVSFDNADMKSALRLIQVCNPDNHPIRLFSRGAKLTLYTVDDDCWTRAEIPVKGKVKVAVNPKYLADIMNQLPDGRVVLRWKEGNKPLVFKSKGEAHVVMPMFVAEWAEKTPETSSTPSQSNDTAAAVAEAERITAETHQGAETTVAV